MKILVVDGDTAYRTGLETMILGLGHECMTAPEGRAGWELLKHFRFDVLIADWKLPLLDGVHLCQRARTELESGHLYIILATALGSWEQARESMLDNFRAFNEMYGHEQGDTALKAIAVVLDATSRAGDTCYRYGGEEFLCIYPEQAPERAHIVVQRLRARVALLGIPHPRGAVGGVITVSAGIAEMSADTMTAQHAIQAADMALYQAKKLGRDRTELAVPSPRLRVSAAAMGPAEDVAMSVVLPR